jgi:cytochrome c553
VRLFLAMRLVIVYLGAAFAFGNQPYLACPPFIVYTHSESGFPGAIWTAMRNEVESILSPTGWHVKWEDTATPAHSASVALAIVRFKGECNVDDIRLPSSGDATLGRTHVNGSDIISFADVFCDAIRASLADRLSIMRAGGRDLWYGRAVGRVVAHELYHILTGEKHHGSRGVAQAHFSPEELLADDFRYHTDQVRSLRSKLAPVLLSAFAWPGTHQRKSITGATLFIASGCIGCHGVLADGTAWGPPIRAGVDAAALSRRLKSTHHEMYRRAKNMRLLWPPLASTDVSEIARYLNGFRNPDAAQARIDRTPGKYTAPPLEYLKPSIAP